MDLEILGDLPPVLQAAVVIVAACSIISMGCPNESKNAALDKLWKALNLVGMNLFKSKNDPTI